MKRMLMAIVAVLMITTAQATYAQGTTTGTPASAKTGNGLDKSGSIRMEAELYPVRVDVTRVFIHTQGYKVVYRKGTASFAEAYIPTSWFTSGGKAMLVYGRGPQYPYMFAYYNSDGSFSHLKLYVLRNMRDATWGVIEGDAGDKFKVETLKLEF